MRRGLDESWIDGRHEWAGLLAMIYLQLALGFVLLLAGGDFLVRGAVALAQRLGISPLLIGLVLVGFGTSTPELVTSLQAALVGSSGIAVGNVVGSNTANILLILGCSALIFPLTASRGAFLRDGPAMLGAAVVCLAVVLIGELSRWAGVAMLALLGVYLVYTYLSERRNKSSSAKMHREEASALQPVVGRAWLAPVLVVAGLVLTILGAKALVSTALELSRAAGLSDTVVGLTIVAVGTSLPELVTSIMAAVRRHSDVAIGNVVGSNIFNVLGILGVTAIIHPIAVPEQIAELDIWVMLGASVALVAFAMTGSRVTRLEGGICVAAYAVYVLHLGSVL
jgi:cation:H+ antiporter